MPRETSVVRLHSPDIHGTPRRRRQKRGNDAGPVSAHKVRTRLVLAAHEGRRVQRVPVRAVLVHVQRAKAQGALDGGERHVGRAEAVAHQVEEPAEDDAEDTGGTGKSCTHRALPAVTPASQVALAPEWMDTTLQARGT